MRYLSAEFLVELNKRRLVEFSGFYIADDNVANGDSLAYLVEAVPGVIFGKELHEGLYRKAAAYAWYIIRDHVFRDGNKRTGMSAAFLFLELNGRRVPDSAGASIVTKAVDIAQGSISLDEIAE